MKRNSVFMVMILLLLKSLPGGNVPSVLAQEPQAAAAPDIYFERLAVAPVLVGHRQPNMDESLDDTLSCPIDQICADDPSIPSDAGPAMMRLVHSYLEGRYGPHVVSLDDVETAYAAIRLDGAKDTPRTLVNRLGKDLSADLMMIGTVWRYRDHGAIEGFPNKPASVAFALYLVEPYSGRLLWRGVFDQSQGFALDDMAKFSARIKMGFKWLSANELARHGVTEVFRPFPPTIKPLLRQKDSE